MQSFVHKKCIKCNLPADMPDGTCGSHCDKCDVKINLTLYNGENLCQNHLKHQKRVDALLPKCDFCSTPAVYVSQSSLSTICLCGFHCTSGGYHEAMLALEKNDALYR